MKEGKISIWGGCRAAGVCLVMMLSGMHVMAQVRVMPLGDSITSSIDGQASYRFWLWNQLERNRFDVDFVGTMWGVGDGASGIYGDFDQDHEGHPGDTTDDILYGLEDWVSSTQPDAVLLCIGGNDIEQGRSASHALAGTRHIINVLRAANPHIAILWATLPSDPHYRSQIKAYNSGVMRLAPALSRSGSPVRIVNLASGFSPSRDTVDGVHPNVSGERKIAARFYSSLAPLLRRMGAYH